MANYKQAFMSYMDEKGVRYDDIGEDLVRVTYNGEKQKTIPVVVSFDKDGGNLVSFHCWDIASFKEKPADGLVACNFLNSKYRWVKFYITDKSDAVCSNDALLDEDCGAECLQLVLRMVDIIDDAYPVFMKALYS